MRVIIFGSTIERAQDKLLEITEGKSEVLIKAKTRNYVEFINGDMYKAVKTSDTARGYRADRVAIDSRIEYQFVTDIISPALHVSCLPDSLQVEWY